MVFLDQVGPSGISIRFAPDRNSSLPIECIAIVTIVWLLPLKKVEGSTMQKLKKVDYIGVAVIVVAIVLILVCALEL